MRTLIRMQSLLIAQTKVTFSKRHKSTLKLQRHGRTISLLDDSDEIFSDTSLIYGNEESEPSKSNINQVSPQLDITATSNMEQYGTSENELLSPRSRILHKGTQPKRRSRFKLQELSS